MPTDAYRWISRIYDALIEPALAPARRLGLELCPPQPGWVVLDVGCGTGSQLALYAPAGCRLMGIDPSPAMVERARARLGAAAAVDLADASRMPYADGSVDLVLLSMMLHELAQPTRSGVLAEVKRVLRTDGRILVFDYHPGPPRFPRGWAAKPLIVLVEILAGREHFRHYREFLRAGGMPAVAARHGLAVETARVIKAGNFGLFVLRDDARGKAAAV